EVLRAIVKLRPAEIVMVSCDPPTFARDARRLAEASYHPAQIHVIDLFPGTFHVETVGLFTR
ncbi:MAG: 23S rRNA (uracil(1939)-C(5))-methyltransferase RlmD, partial [Candidatus Krumholzibacteria bacterium]|nr:23S rRNA (uracil(1939)-C(5))-methyltransferase RlmD [Candidatus Krumholzibacteria bacterium]